MRFAERANPDARKRPVCELLGFDPTRNQGWSARRAAILARLSELAPDFQAAHWASADAARVVEVGPQATLETPEAAHPGE